MIFAEKTFANSHKAEKTLRIASICGLLALAVPRNVMYPNFLEKTFANSHKATKFVKLFSLESFPIYGESLEI